MDQLNLMDIGSFF